MRLTKKELFPLAALIGAGFLLMTKSAFAGPPKSLSEMLDQLCQEFAAKYGLNWLWLKAIAMNESSYGRHPAVARGLANPSDVEGSKSSDGLSWGIWQLQVSTARDYRPGTTAADLNNPRISAELAARHFARILKKFGGDLDRAVRAYNQGEGNEAKGYRGAAVTEYLSRFKRNLALASKEALA